MTNILSKGSGSSRVEVCLHQALVVQLRARMTNILSMGSVCFRVRVSLQQPLVT